MKTLHLSIIVILILIVSNVAFYGPTKSYAGYVGPVCNEKDVMGFSPVTSKVAFLSNEGSAILENFTLYTVNSDGTGGLAKIGVVASDSSPVIISPDGKTIVFSSGVNGINQLFASNIDGTDMRRLTNGTDSLSAIAIFPNSTKIIFGTNLLDKTGFANIYSINSDGTHLFQITHDPQDKFWTAVSANGKIIGYSTEVGVNTDKIFVVNSDGTNWHFVTYGSLFSYEKPVISDNGSKIVFSKNNSVEDFLYTINTDGTGLAGVGPLVTPPISNNFMTTREGNEVNYWPILKTPESSKIIITEQINGTMQLFASDDNGVHVIPLVDNSYFKPNPNCEVPSDSPGQMRTVTSSSSPLQSPLKQFKSGIVLKNIECDDNLKLVVKKENNHPACVKLQTVQKLVALGWAALISPVTQETSDKSSVLKLDFSSNPSIIKSGQAIGIDISLSNTHSESITVPVANDWPIDSMGLSACSDYPVGIAILEGYHTEQNMTTLLEGFYTPENMTHVAPLSLYQGFGGCYSEPSIKSYTFQSLNSKTTPECYDYTFQCPKLVVTKSHLSFSGYYVNNQFRLFNAPTYTIVGGDEWGHIAIQHFTVTNSTK
ncbi:MAG: PD40 domain-containing protein [Thaumarchaeota archaeon]|nr:PD40 domain-containing protein [Nitrososphaerota archaeon]